MHKPRRLGPISATIGLAGLVLLVGACSSTKVRPGNNAAGQQSGPTAPPDTKRIPTSYQPKPGDLLFYTNGSISYNSTAKHPWIAVIDAREKRIVAASEISEVGSSPHGLGVSPDGTSLYLPAGIGSAIPASGSAPGGVKFGNGVTVIDARTLKMTQSIPTKDAPHHMHVLNDRYIYSDAWGVDQVAFVLDPANGNMMVHEIAAAPFGGRPYIGFPSPDGKYIYMTVRPPAEAANHDAWISRINLDTWTVEKVAEVGAGAVWTEFTRDGKFAYVTIGEEDWIMKVDLEKGKVVAKSATGRGPYGAVLSPDEKRLFVVSKGEGGRGQRGGTFVAIDTETMQVIEERPACKAFVCQPDHALVSPDGTELWIDNNMGYITVFDLKTLAMKTEITMPLLADPHGGVFVQYDQAGKGHVVMDIGGPHGGVSPYAFDNVNGVPTLAQALTTGWKPAASSSALGLGKAQLVQPSASGAASASESAGSGNTVEFVVEDFFFEPKSATVTAGSQVTFKLKNTGQAVHNFTSTDLQIKEHDVNANSSAEFNWTVSAKPGTYKFNCTFHPGMEGTITVVK